MPPSQGSYRVFIVDEVHMLSSAAFNAFLKTLEEPPSYVIFILATTEKHKIIPTILSRCQIYDFKRITVRDMIDHLSYVASKEGITADTAALNIIARKADGAMRDALSIFDQVAASSRGNITYQSAIDNLNVLDYNYYNRLLDCFLAGKVLDTWMIYKEIRDRGFDSHFFINGLGDYMRDLMVARDPSTIVLLEADDEARKAMAATAAKCSPDFIYRAMNLCNEADLNYRTASNKQFLIELTLAKICQLLSPSRDNGAEGEGRLQKINPGATTAPQSQAPAQPQAAAQQAPTPAAQPQGGPQHIAQQAQGSPQPAPRPQPVPQNSQSSQSSPSSQTYQPPRPVAPGRKPLMRPAGTFSINHSKEAAETARTAAASGTAAPQRNEPYTREQLHKAWQKFMQAHPTEHILVNTMRASFPAPQEGHTYKIMVENDMQRQTVEHAFPELLRSVRDDLSNDHFSLVVEINQGAASPHTWNEREVLNHMVENIPALRGFIDDLGLTLG